MRNRRKSLNKLFGNASDTNTYICIECFDDSFLKTAIQNFNEQKCNICNNNKNPSISAELISKLIKQIIPKYFDTYNKSHTSHESLNLDQVVSKVLGCNDSKFCTLMTSFLLSQTSNGTEHYFSVEKKYYERKLKFETEEEKRVYLIDQWNIIAIKLTHSQRYFNDDAERFFSSIFEEATQAKTNTLFGMKSTIIRQYEAGSELFRARRLDSPADEEKVLHAPSKELGAPPKESAGHNRMNSAGIPLFYAAKDKATSIAEVRPSIGDNIATVKFKTTRELIFFDFRGFNAPWEHARLSYFEDHYEERKNHRALLSYLHRIISQPVRAGGSGYIITQAMAEYLSRKHTIKFDGIIFNSVQEKGGINYVIFSDKSSDLDLLKPNWQPTFPVECIGKPSFHTVDTVKYGGNWHSK